MLHLLKRLGLFLAIGGVLGDVVTMIVAPGALAWFQTPGTGSALCNCVEVSRQTADALVRAQLVGTGIGAVALGVVGELLWRLWDARRQKKLAALPTPQAEPVPAPAPTPAPAVEDAAPPSEGT